MRINCGSLQGEKVERTCSEGLLFAFDGSVVFHFLSNATGLSIFGLTRYSFLRLTSPFVGNHEHVLGIQVYYVGGYFFELLLCGTT